MSNSASLTLPAPSLDRSPADGKWQREYQAFLRLKGPLLATHAGQYVVVHDGAVVDSGPDDVALAMRFFAQHGNVSVHIGLVAAGPEAAARIPHYRQQGSGDEA
jgi:hypothetical protein